MDDPRNIFYNNRMEQPKTEGHQEQKTTTNTQGVDVKKLQQLADKYKVTWSSLILIGHDKQGDEVNNLTTFAFANARNNPEEFKRQLTDKIQAMLND